MLQGSFEVVNFAMGRMSSCPVTFKQRDETVVGCSGRVDQEGEEARGWSYLSSDQGFRVCGQGSGSFHQISLLKLQVLSRCTRTPTPVQCKIDQSKLHAPLLSAALQNRLTAGLSHCSHTFESLLFIQVCSDPTPIYCKTGFGKMCCLLLNAALQNRLQQDCDTANTPVKICSSYRCALTQHHCTATPLLAKCVPHCSMLLCKTGSQQACVIAITLVKVCSSYRCAVTQQQCCAVLIRANCMPHCSMLLCKTG